MDFLRRSFCASLNDATLTTTNVIQYLEMILCIWLEYGISTKCIRNWSIGSLLPLLSRTNVSGDSAEIRTYWFGCPTTCWFGPPVKLDRLLHVNIDGLLHVNLNGLRRWFQRATRRCFGWPTTCWFWRATTCFGCPTTGWFRCSYYILILDGLLYFNLDGLLHVDF